MFFFLAILSTVGYAIQATWMASFFRRYDPLVVTAARGLALLLTMSLLLIFSKDFSALEDPGFWAGVGVASALAALGVWAAGCSVRHLTVGLAVALQQAGMVIVVVVLEAVFLGQKPSLFQYPLLFALVAVNGFLARGGAAARKTDSQEPEAKPVRGVIQCLVFSLLLGAAYVLLTRAARGSDPFAAAWLWEGGIGICAAVLCLIRAAVLRARGQPSPPMVSMRAWGQIFIASSPTAIGTGLYAVAVTLGAASTMNAINSSQIALCALLGWWWYGERFPLRAWVALGASIVLIALLAVVP